MNYKLAKRLKNAGFPYKEDKLDRKLLCACTEPVCKIFGERYFRFNEELYKEPTLSELIKKCGRGKGFALHEISSTSYSAKDDFANWQDATTPEEAVAKLWLKLNHATKNSR